MGDTFKSKPKYRHYPKKSTGFQKSSLDVNLRGFLCSCNFREKDCIRESYNLLNKYHDKLTGEKLTETATAADDNADIEDSLANEIQSLKAETRKTRLFQALESGAKNFLFIRTTLDDPVGLAAAIVRDIYETKCQQTRYLIRLVPVEVTCKAYVQDICTAFEPLAVKYFTDAPLSFSIVYNHRNNNSLSKDDVIKCVAEKVSAIRPDHKVNLTSADVSIVIEVIKGIALLAVVPDYIKYKKYNLLMASESPQAASQVAEGEDAAVAVEDEKDPAA